MCDYSETTERNADIRTDDENDDQFWFFPSNILEINFLYVCPLKKDNTFFDCWNPTNMFNDLEKVVPTFFFDKIYREKKEIYHWQIIFLST